MAPSPGHGTSAAAPTFSPHDGHGVGDPISPLNLQTSPYTQPLSLDRWPAASIATDEYGRDISPFALPPAVTAPHDRDRDVSPFGLSAPTAAWHFAPATILPPADWSDQSQTDTNTYHDPNRRKWRSEPPEVGPSVVAGPGERFGSAPAEAQYTDRPVPPVAGMYDHLLPPRRTPHISLLSVSPPPSNAVPQAADRSPTPPESPLSPAPPLGDETALIDIGPLPDTIPQLADGSAPVPMHVLFPADGGATAGDTGDDNADESDAFAYGTQEEIASTAEFIANIFHQSQHTRGAERDALRKTWIHWVDTKAFLRKKTLCKAVVDECIRVTRPLFDQFGGRQKELKKAYKMKYEDLREWSSDVGLTLFRFALEPPSYQRPPRSPTPSPPSSPLVAAHNPLLSDTANELATQASWFKAHYATPVPMTSPTAPAPFRPIARMRRNAADIAPFDRSMPDEWAQAKKMALAYLPDGRERADSVFVDRDQVAQPVPFNPHDYTYIVPLRVPKRKRDELPFPVESRVPVHQRKLPKLSHRTRGRRSASVSVFETESLRRTISTYVGDAILNLRHSVWHTVDMWDMRIKMDNEIAAARALLDPEVVDALEDNKNASAAENKRMRKEILGLLEGQELTDARKYLACVNTLKQIERAQDKAVLREVECDAYLKPEQVWPTPPSPRAMTPAPHSARNYRRRGEHE